MPMPLPVPRSATYWSIVATILILLIAMLTGAI